MLSILTILDNCQMKAFQDISILIKRKLFCLKTFFFWKKLLFEKNMCLKTKIKKLLFWKKTVTVCIRNKKKLFLEKKTSWKKNFFGKNTFEKQVFFWKEIKKTI